MNSVELGSAPIDGAESLPITAASSFVAKTVEVIENRASIQFAVRWHQKPAKWKYHSHNNPCAGILGVVQEWDTCVVERSFCQTYHQRITRFEDLNPLRRWLRFRW